MSTSIQTSNGISVETSNGKVKINGSVKYVFINGKQVEFTPKGPTVDSSKRWWHFFTW